MTFNSYRRENGVDQKYRFQGQEHIDDLDLGWDSFKWRNHQPDIGRFFNIDPLANKYVHNSPYAFAENRVIDGRELEGLEWVNAKGQKIYDPKANDGKGGYTEVAGRNDKRLGESLQRTETGRTQFGKLVNSTHPIETKLNFDSKVTKSSNGNVQYGNTENEGSREVDFNNGKAVGVATVEKSVITINVESVESAAKTGGSFGTTNMEGMNVDEILGVTMGHEIEHTTNENYTLSTSGKDSEAPAYKVSDKIIEETKKAKEQQQKPKN